MFKTRESFGMKVHSNSRYLEFETCEQANLAFDILKKLQKKNAAQQNVQPDGYAGSTEAKFKSGWTLDDGGTGTTRRR